MTQQNEMVTDTADREIVINRLLNAPRELVFEAFTKPEHLINWWGPKGFTNTFNNYELRVGGQWNFMMHGPDGTDYPNQIIYTEIVKPSYLAYTHGTGQPNDTHGFSVTITFEDQNGKTNLTMRTIFKTTEERDYVIKQVGAIEGGNQTIDKLEEQLTKMFDSPDMVISTSRVFDAPRALVFKAWSQPEHLAVWFGPQGFANTFHQFDFIPGGHWKLTMHGPNGGNYYNESVFVEIEKDRKIIYDHISSHYFRVVVLLEDEGEKTRMTFAMHFASSEECSKVRKVVMLSNEENLDRLAAELLKMK